MKVTKLHRVLIIFHLIITVTESKVLGPVDHYLPNCYPTQNYTDYKQSSFRSDLFCSQKYDNEICEGRYKFIACACCTVPIWIIDKSPVLPVELEYIGIKGFAILTSFGEGTSLHRLVHSNGILAELPRNLCDFPSIVEIILSKNRITRMESVSCLKELDTIDMSYNLLTKVSNLTFQKLSKLRVIDLSYNRIKHIDPNTFLQTGLQSLHPMTINVSDNKLERIDFSNVFMLNISCVVVYKRNLIRNITNELNFKIDALDYEMNNPDFGGRVDLSENKINYLPNPEIFGLKNLLEYAQLKDNHFLISFKDNPLICDCNWIWAFPNALDILRRYPIGINPFGFNCKKAAYQTEDVRWGSYHDHITDETLSKLQCHPYSCPSNCSCSFIPTNNRIVIDCKGAAISEFKGINLNPSSWRVMYVDVIHKFNEAALHLHLSKNSLRYIPYNVEIINRTKSLDLSKNRLKHIHTAALRILPRDARLNFSHNDDLKTLPRAILRFHIDNIDLSGLKLECSCNDVNKMYQWLPDFLKSKETSDIRTPLCNIDGKIVEANIVTAEYLGCNDNFILKNKFIFSAFGLLTISVVLIGFIFAFRLEIHILYRKMRQLESSNKQYAYDIYISMDDGNELLLRWMLHRFCPALETHGYKVYFPPRDMSVGCFREEVIRETIERSRYVIGFITLSFAREMDEWMALEWRIAWQQYISVYDRKLICINYDQLRYRDIEWPILQKFLRWGTCIDFCTRQKFIKTCMDKVGNPRGCMNMLKVSKPKFNPFEIYFERKPAPFNE